MITLVIAEDHQSLIDGIKVFLEYEDDIKVVGEANDGERLLEIVNAKRPDVVLTDIRMPGPSGIDLLDKVKELRPDILMSVSMRCGFSVSSFLITLLAESKVCTSIPPSERPFSRTHLIDSSSSTTQTFLSIASF